MITHATRFKNMLRLKNHEDLFTNQKLHVFMITHHIFEYSSAVSHDVCRSRPESERNNCEPDWSDFPAPVGFPTDFRTCYNDTTGKTCYTYPEWKASTVVTACAIDNKENDEPKNKWYNKLDESVILLSVVGVAVLVGLFVAGYYGYKKLKQNEGVQNTENLL